ncbi:MAG TPA: hypothetical protein VMD04_04560 [Candidatus Margulisiibacteriota bacterium]|nr:hypothetical protein [Candidatus Margulisiibacteriota bacterium]
MKARPIILLLILVILTMLISFFLTQRSIQNSPLPQQISREEEAAIQSQLPMEAQTILPEKRGITIVKRPAPKEKETLSSQKSERQMPAGITTETNKQVEQGAAAAGTGNETASQPQAGITELDKRPSQERINELNSKGIILY